MVSCFKEEGYNLAKLFRSNLRLLPETVHDSGSAKGTYPFSQLLFNSCNNKREKSQQEAFVILLYLHIT